MPLVTWFVTHDQLGPYYMKCGTLPRRDILNKSPNEPASPVRRLVIEATFPV